MDPVVVIPIIGPSLGSKTATQSTCPPPLGNVGTAGPEACRLQQWISTIVVPNHRLLLKEIVPTFQAAVFQVSLATSNGSTKMSPNLRLKVKTLTFKVYYTKELVYSLWEHKTPQSVHWAALNIHHISFNQFYEFLPRALRYHFEIHEKQMMRYDCVQYTPIYSLADGQKQTWTGSFGAPVYANSCCALPPWARTFTIPASLTCWIFPHSQMQYWSNYWMLLYTITIMHPLQCWLWYLDQNMIERLPFIFQYFWTSKLHASKSHNSAQV